MFIKNISQQEIDFHNNIAYVYSELIIIKSHIF